MVGGLVVTLTVASHHTADPASCDTVPANWKLALGMYSVSGAMP